MNENRQNKQERLEMNYHNLMCYSKNYLMSEPKEGFEKEWEQAKENIQVLEAIMDNDFLN